MIKLAKRFGEVTLALENLLTVAIYQGSDAMNLVCDIQTREVVSLMARPSRTWGLHNR